MTEKDFMYKCLEALRKHGFTACVLFKPKYRQQLVDVIAMKDGLAYPIEFKGYRTTYSSDQKRKQVAIFNGSNTSFFMFKERHRKKNVFVEITSPNEGSRLELVVLSKPFNAAMEKSKDEIVMLGSLSNLTCLKGELKSE